MYTKDLYIFLEQNERRRHLNKFFNINLLFVNIVRI